MCQTHRLSVIITQKIFNILQWNFDDLKFMYFLYQVPHFIEIGRVSNWIQAKRPGHVYLCECPLLAKYCMASRKIEQSGNTIFCQNITNFWQRCLNAAFQLHLAPLKWVGQHRLSTGSTNVCRNINDYMISLTANKYHLHHHISITHLEGDQAKQ